MTTSQHLDKSPPPRRWRAVFRRAAPVPGADDARAPAAANRQIVRLEMDKAGLQNRLDRLAGQCAPPCWHAAHLEAAQLENMRLQVEHADVYRRMRAMLDQLHDVNAPAPTDEAQ